MTRLISLLLLQTCLMAGESILLHYVRIPPPEPQSAYKDNIMSGRLLRAPYFLGAPLALALLPKIESGARARALTQN